jgi:hypothetical protein
MEDTDGDWLRVIVYNTLVVMSTRCGSYTLPDPETPPTGTDISVTIAFRLAMARSMWNLNLKKGTY